MSLDLEKHLVFYGSYHSNSINVAIHMVCVPIILMTSFLLVRLSCRALPCPCPAVPRAPRPCLVQSQ